MNSRYTSEYLTVTALPAGPGDCIWIEYGVDKSPHHCVLIDTGVKGTLEHFKPKLLAMPAGIKCTLVVTHIDDDHIGSATALLSDEALAQRIHDVWFNGRSHCGGRTGVETFGVASALELDTLLSKGWLPWNCIANGGALFASPNAPILTAELPGGMKVSVLGPTPDQLVALGKMWDAGVEKLLEKEEAEEFEAPPVPDGMEAFGAPAINVSALAKFNDPDKSVPNCSSIALLMEFAGRRLVLAGDYPACSLKPVVDRIGLRNVDFLKVAHHGSKKNSNLRLIEDLRPGVALISTNGNHGHPNDECLAMLVSPKGGRTIYCNYPQARLEQWTDADMKGLYEYDIVFGNGTVGIEL